MKNLFGTFTLSLLSFIALSEPICIEVGDDPASPGPKTSKIEIICENVSSSLVFDFVHHKDKPHFHDLIIRNSEIDELPSNSSISKFVHTQKLVLENLGIKEIAVGAFNGLDEVKELNLNGNKLTKLSNGVFDNLKQLRNLDLSDNSIDEIEENAFSQLSALKDLYLNSNNIITLPKNLFKQLKALERLNISNNPLKQLNNVDFANLKQLSARSVASKIFEIDLSRFQIESVDLTGGHLENIDWTYFTGSIQDDHNLPILYLSKNNIKLAQNWNKLRAEFLYITENEITELEIPEKVVYLYIHHNKIKHLINKPSNRTKLLKSLDLSFNELSEINSDSFSGMSKLEHLNLAHNQITVLVENTFINCQNLNDIDVSNNKIERIEPNAFKDLRSLSLINLSHNNLETLEMLSFSGLLLPFNLIVDCNPLDWAQIKHLVINVAQASVILYEDHWVCELENRTSHKINKQHVYSVHNVNNIFCGKNNCKRR